MYMVKSTANVKPFKVKILFQACIGKSEEHKPVPIGVVCEGHDTASFFTTNARWRERQELLDWVRRQSLSIMSYYPIILLNWRNSAQS